MNLRPLLAAVSLASLPAAFAAKPVVQTITLEECLQLAFQHNLDLQIVRYLPELAQLNLEANQGAYDPNFSFGYGGNKATRPGQSGIDQIKAPPNVSWSQNFDTALGGLLPTGAQYQLFGNLTDTRNKFSVGTNIFGENLYGYQSTVPANTGIQLTQPLLQNMWIDSTRWSIALNKKAIRQEEQSVRLQLINTATDVQLSYYNLAAARQSVVVQKQAVELAERLLSENRKRVEVGALAPLEEKQAEAQVAISRADLISAQQTYGVAQNTLKRLLTSDYGELAETTFEPGDKFSPQPYPFSRQESWSRGLTARPDIIQSQLEMEKQNITVRYRRNQMFPQLDLTGTFGLAAQTTTVSESLSDISNNQFKNFGVGAQLSFPLGNRTARSGFRSAKVERERLVLQHKQLEQSIMVAVDNAILAAESAFERISATRQGRIYAEAALDAEQKKLENGKSTTFEVLRLQRDLTTASSDEVRAVADYYRAMAVLFQDEGSTLERLGVKITVN